MATINDHPQVARTIETGYPEEERFVCCSDCGGEFYGSDKLYECEGEWICPECTRDRILDAIGIRELAAAFGIFGKSAAELLEVS